MVVELTDKYLNKNGLTKDCEVSLWFVGRKRAKDLNIKYRNRDYIPQVLGFPLNRTADTDGIIRLGDIVICTEKLKYEVRFMNSTIEQVLDEWIGHGIDNLLK